MKKRDGWSLVACIVILIVLVFLAPQYGARVRAWLGPLAAPQAISSILVAENEELKAELAQLARVAAQLPSSSPAYLPAMVYSRYPFNFKNEFLVDAGANEGVAEGKAVVFQGILVGVVLKTFPDSSLIQTVFDGNFKIPVRVGAAGDDGLLTGGASPKVASVAKSATVHAGDIVYAAAEGLPYGLPVAVVQGTSTSADNLFEEAALTFAYDENSIQVVAIAR
ncbi:MAG: rod shape-determining protein MreC [Minisyncoccia bacterium]